MENAPVIALLAVVAIGFWTLVFFGIRSVIRGVRAGRAMRQLGGASYVASGYKAAGLAAHQAGRTVTFMIPCGSCGYKTTATVSIAVDGTVLSGDGLAHQFRCDHCTETFFVSNDSLRQHTDRFV